MSHPSTERVVVPLHFEQLSLVVCAIPASIPTLVWLMALLVPFRDHAPPSSLQTVLGVIALMVALFVLPWLVALRVQSARQPRGARIEVDDDGVREVDGNWVRTAIPWSKLEVGWSCQTYIRTSRIFFEALVLRDRQTDARIHVWGLERPAGVARTARRLRAADKDLTTLLHAVEAHNRDFERVRARRDESPHGLSFGHPDWSRSADRWRPPWLVLVGRVGYVIAVLGALLAMPSFGVGVALGFVGAALLSLRALPALREWRVLSEVNPSNDAHAEALHSKRRAVLVELALRLSFVALTIHAPFSFAHCLG